MDQQQIEQAAAMANRIGHIFVATADADTLPHLALARKLTVKNHALIAIEDWYSSGGLDVFRSNKRVSVVVWDRDVYRGFQLLGEARFPRKEINKALDNDQLLIMVSKVVDFTRLPEISSEE